MDSNHKYDNVELGYLIRQIQIQFERLTEERRTKKLTSMHYSTKMKEIGEMRVSAIFRLKKKSRSQSDFFPIGSKVIYQRTDVPFSPQDAIVRGYEGNDWCLIELEKDQNNNFLKVEPNFLTLKHIRINY